MSAIIERVDVPPRHDVMRMAPFALRADDTDEENDGQTLDGYGAVFNRETIIDSWEGKFREKISPGAMKKSFRENPPIIQFDHGRHPVIGSIPIAALRSISEDTHPTLAPEGGAHVIGRLEDNWLVQPVRDAIASESITGMSFRFSVVRQKWFDADGKEIRDEEVLRDHLRRTWFEDVPDDELLLRDLKELKVPELGPVVWPAYGDTSVGVRAQEIVLAIRSDAQLARIVCRSAVVSDDPGAIERIGRIISEAGHRDILDELRDPDVARDVARVLVSESSLDVPARTGHPSIKEEPSSDDAPTNSGHPSDDNDAPPTQGHPSMSQRRITAELARLNGRLDVAQRYIDNSDRRGAHQ